MAPLTAFALVALTVGLLARERWIPSKGYFQLFFSDTLHLKAWFASAAVLLRSDAALHRRVDLPQAALASSRLDSGASTAGRAGWPSRSRSRSPTTASSSSASRMRRVVSSRTRCVGCAVYGAFAAKVLIVRLHRFPVWVLPTAGGLLFSVLVAVWYTSAVWFFDLARNRASQPRRA